MHREIFGIAGGILAGTAGLYYLWTIFKGYTKPHRVTWFGWSVVGILGAWATFDGGAGAGGLVVITYAFTVSLTFLVSLIPGYGKPGADQKLDYLFAVFATLGILVWRFGHLSPAIAATIAILADSWFSWLTIRESWKQPKYEALGPWIVGCLAGLLGILGLANYGYAALAFPAYAFIDCVLITSILLYRKPGSFVQRLKS